MDQVRGCLLYTSVIDFNKQIVKFEKGNKPVRIEFKKVVNNSKVTGIKMLHKQISDREIETKINICLESDSLENEEREMHERNESVWANRADKFFNENTVVGNTQREELWAVVEQYRDCLLYTSN